MIINLSDCFPEAQDGTRSPLPKQQLFLDYAMDKDKAKYITYLGGIGSGKSVIGCITVITWAVMYGGEYLICRQFAPELRDTTMKTFFDLCPKDLIIEHRVADALVRIRSASGQPATIMFRQLEEPDKLRSMNLSGFYIDECNQVSEAAFMLLQGRLRNPKGLRKGILTSNPKGHDWLYRWFVKQDHLKTLEAKEQFALIKAPSTENTHLPEGYIESMMASWSDDRIQREIMGSFDAFEGQVYEEFRRDVHVIKPFAIPAKWTRTVGIDHGYRNPAAWVYLATDYDGTHYVYREYYQRETLIEDICKQNLASLKQNEKITAAYIDPSVGNRKGANGLSDMDAYLEHLPRDFPLLPANNAVEAGIDRLKSLLKLDKNGKAQLYVFDTCVNLIEEITNYRYQEQRPSEEGNKNPKEAPVKANDHACFIGSTLVETNKGPRRIDEIKVGDKVLTRLGFQPVLESGRTGTAEVIEYTLSNGNVLTSTSNHPIFDENGKIVEIGHSTSLMGVPCLSKSFLITSFLEKLVSTTDQMEQSVKRARDLCTEKFTNSSMAQFLKDTTYTTSIMIQRIMSHQILRPCPDHNTYQIISTKMDEQKQLPGSSNLKKLDRSRSSGTGHQKAANGTETTPLLLPQKYAQKKTRLLWFVTSVGKIIGSIKWLLGGQNSAIKIVGQKTLGNADVYNLKVAIPEFALSCGIMVHNCDAIRYVAMSFPEAESPKDRVYDKIKYTSLEGSLHRELKQLRTGKKKYKDPFGDYNG